MRGHHSTMYFAFQHGLVLCLECLGGTRLHNVGDRCVFMCCVGCIVVSGLSVVFSGCSVGVFLGGLERLARPLMLICMACFGFLAFRDDNAYRQIVGYGYVPHRTVCLKEIWTHGLTKYKSRELPRFGSV